MDRTRRWSIFASVCCNVLHLVLACAESSNENGRIKPFLGLSSNKYSAQDKVGLYASKVGPFSNPSETYPYYDTLPWCAPANNAAHDPKGFGKGIFDAPVVLTSYDIQFRVDTENQVLCSKQLTVAESAAFKSVIEQDYYYQMFLDDLPVWGFIGRGQKLEGGLSYFLFTHVHIDILYNADRIIEVNAATEPNSAVKLEEDMPVNVSFTYSVKWRETSITFDRRMDRYHRYAVAKQALQVHWYSIVNSFVTVLFLIGLLAVTWSRKLKKAHQGAAGLEPEETGWQSIKGDVFRFPSHTSLFSSTIGTGTQFLVLAVGILLLGLLKQLYPFHCAFFPAAVVLYALTAGVAGYVSGSTYKSMGGTNWMRNILLTCVLFCGPMAAVFAVHNTVAVAYGVTTALTGPALAAFAVLWAVVSVPPTVLGGIAGKTVRAEFEVPCPPNKIPRDIPRLAWHRRTLPQMLLAGVLPFSATIIELFYISLSLWGHHDYVSPIVPILLIAFLLLLAVTALVVVIFTVCQLQAENHRWWWRSVLCGGSAAIFAYVYCCFFYFCKSDMSGLLQTSFFFGYMLMACYALFLVLATVGYRAALAFVQHMYRCQPSPYCHPLL